MDEHSKNVEDERLTTVETGASISNDEDSTTNETRYAPLRAKPSYRQPALERRATEIFNQIPLAERTQLQRLATLTRTHTTVPSEKPGLEKVDTMAGISNDDKRLDPESPNFVIFIWARVLMRALDDNGLKRSKSGYTFKNFSVSGTGSSLSLQKDVGSIIMAPLRLGEFFSFGCQSRKQILRGLHGVVKSGEMLVVLGRPGSGCTPFLKSVCGELAGLNVDEGSTVHYNEIQQDQMFRDYKGEVSYNQEVDKHFPHLTVGETLEFAAAARAPQSRAHGMTRAYHIKHMTQVVMAVFGLTHHEY